MSASTTGRITTHVLDTATGRPGAGMAVTLTRLSPGVPEPIGRFITNADGRCDGPLLQGDALTAGLYELAFDVAGWRGDGPGFYDEIPIRFRVDNAVAHHHVPLILSPYGYSTYRGT